MAVVDLPLFDPFKVVILVCVYLFVTFVNLLVHGVKKILGLGLQILELLIEDAHLSCNVFKNVGCECGFRWRWSFLQISDSVFQVASPGVAQCS